MVPRSLRIWFVVHFWLDLLFAVPLFLSPRWTLSLFGWTAIDPVATRLVAAALFGIGIESLLGRNAGPGVFRALLNLKILWSGAATLGLVWSQLEGGPAAGWFFALVFAAFGGVWLRYRRALGDPSAEPA